MPSNVAVLSEVNPVLFIAFTKLCSHHHNPVLEHFRHPSKDPHSVHIFFTFGVTKLEVHTEPLCYALMCKRSSREGTYKVCTVN